MFAAHGLLSVLFDSFDRFTMEEITVSSSPELNDADDDDVEQEGQDDLINLIVIDETGSEDEIEINASCSPSPKPSSSPDIEEIFIDDNNCEEEIQPAETVKENDIKMIENEELETVENDGIEMVENEELETVENDELETVENDKLETVENEELETVENEELETVENEELETVDNAVENEEVETVDNAVENEEIETVENEDYKTEQLDECECQNCGYKKQVECLQREVATLKAKLELLESHAICKDRESPTVTTPPQRKLVKQQTGGAVYQSSRTIKRMRSRMRKRAIEQLNAATKSKQTTGNVVGGSSATPGADSITLENHGQGDAQHTTHLPANQVSSSMNSSGLQTTTATKRSSDNGAPTCVTTPSGNARV